MLLGFSLAVMSASAQLPSKITAESKDLKGKSYATKYMKNLFP